ncbi:MFS transporter [Pseudomonas sp. Q1]|uniref:MFS transporter n=1 Tax=Pseudomonas TaxID=286 RepID=UPI0035560648|nr:hypothetical protein [Pseudomonas sp. Q1]
MRRTKNQIIILLCFVISLTERFTQASIPLIVNHLSLSEFEMSLFLSAMSASTVFVGLAIAPSIDNYDQRRFLCLIGLFTIVASLSFFLFNQNQALLWGCLLTFNIGAILRIINFRRLSAINHEVDKSKLSQAHTRMQLSITLAMALAPILLAVTATDNYLHLAFGLLVSSIILSSCTSSIPPRPKDLTSIKSDRIASQMLTSAHHFIFIGMLLSGLFLSTLLKYCQSISANPIQLYSNILLSQVIGLIIANSIFERFFAGQFNRYGLLIITIAIAELAFIYTTSDVVIIALAFVVGVSFQIMFLRSHNQFQRTIPHGLTAKANGTRGLYTFIGITIGYFAGPLLYKYGGAPLVFTTCCAVALLFFCVLNHLTPSNSHACAGDR